MAPTPLLGRGLAPETGAQRVPKGSPLAQLSRSHFQGGEATAEQTHREGRAGLVGKAGQAVFPGPSKGPAAPELSTAACGPRAACAGGPRSRDPARHVMQPWGLKSRGRGAWHLAGLGGHFSAQFLRGVKATDKVPETHSAPLGALPAHLLGAAPLSKGGRCCLKAAAHHPSKTVPTSSEGVSLTTETV